MGEKDIGNKINEFDDRFQEVMDDPTLSSIISWKSSEDGSLENVDINYFPKLVISDYSVRGNNYE